MISFVPDFANLEIEDAYKAQIKTDDENVQFAVDIDTAKAEFIFLIDRSGSMDGKRIESAKEGLITFLKSLPMDSIFNVYSFGTGFETLFN